LEVYKNKKTAFTQDQSMLAFVGVLVKLENSLLVFPAAVFFYFRKKN
jgi:hypothetical protein